MTSAVLDHASQLEKLLLDHDVTIFGYERVGAIAVVRFQMNGRKLRLVVGMPTPSDYASTGTGKIRSITARNDLYWKEVRRRWLAMKNLVAAKLEGIETGITTFEAEFEQFADAEALIADKAGPST